MMNLASSRASSLTSTAPSFTTLRRRAHPPSLSTLSLLSWALMTVPLATYKKGDDDVRAVLERPLLAQRFEERGLEVAHAAENGGHVGWREPVAALRRVEQNLCFVFCGEERPQDLTWAFNKK